MRPKKSLSISLGSTLAYMLLFSSRVYAACDITKGVSSGADCAKGTDVPTGIASQVQDITNLLLYAAGILSVLFIIVGGIRFAISQGNENNIKTARETILYAVIGLIITMLAYAIVNFVIGIFS